MILEREIWACARHVVTRYGKAAWLHAAQSADALLAAGDFDGHRARRRILARIDLLQSDRSGSVVH